MKVVKATVDVIDKLLPVAAEWQGTCNGKRFGIELDLKKGLSDLAGLIESETTDLFLLVSKEDKVVGYLGMTIFDSPIGSQRLAQEHYWFVGGDSRGRGTMLLIRAATDWARQKGCSHIIFNASNLASNMHDKICRFYEKIGMKKFETSYIKEIT